jgi:DNA-directed RNA polymerase specialized sigma subunit
MINRRTIANRLKAQELRQLVHRALQELTDDEMRTIELRYQHKQSPGQAASRVGISRVNQPLAVV